MTHHRLWSRHRTPIRIVLLLTLATLVISGCGASSTAQANHKVIDIGLLAPLTGASAADGTLMQQGALLAINTLNKQGGIDGYRFALDAQNVGNQSTSLVATAAHTLIANSAVKAVVTGYADGSNFEINTFAAVNMPYLIAGNAAQTEAIVAKDPAKYPTIWSFVPSYGPYGTALPPYINSLIQQGKFPNRNKDVFIITSQNPYSEGISTGVAATFKSMGWKIVGNQTVPFSTITDWGVILGEIHSLNPEVIINTDYLTANDATFMKQFVANPTKSLVFIQYGPSVPQFITLAGAAGNGVMYDLLGGPITSSKDALATALTKKFEEAYHANPGDYGLALYDEVMTYARALKEVGNPNDKLAIGRAIGRMHLTLDLGRLSFDPRTHLAVGGAAGIPLQVLQIQHGRHVLIAPSNYADGVFAMPPWMR